MFNALKRRVRRWQGRRLASAVRYLIDGENGRQHGRAYHYAFGNLTIVRSWVMYRTLHVLANGERVFTVVDGEVERFNYGAWVDDLYALADAKRAAAARAEMARVRDAFADMEDVA